MSSSEASLTAPFRDFPLSAETTASSENYLTPWQEHHAVLIVQCVKEVDELRYVLSPKRMTDAQFWHIYFSLAKKRLPPEAFDPTFVPSQLPAEGDLSAKLPFAIPGDLQSRLRQGFSSVSRTLGAAPAQKEALPSASLKELASKGLHAEHGERAGSLGAGSGTEASRGENNGASSSGADGGAVAAELTADPDLEEYLRDVMQQQDGEHAGGEVAEPEAEDEEGDDDYEKYLNELNDGEGTPVVGGSEDATDKDEVDSEDYEGL